MNATATTLPRRSSSLTSLPSWEISVKSGAAPIVGSRCSCPASWATAAPPAARSPARRRPAPCAHAFSSRFSSLRKRQSVPSARSAFGLD